MMIIYGWGDVIRKSYPLGIMACDQCSKFTMNYLAKTVFRVHICYIPVFWHTKNYYIMCDNCKNGVELTKEAYRSLKAAHKGFHKKSLLIECYQYIDYLISSLDYSDENVQSVLKQLKERYPIDEGVVSNQYHTLIEMMLRNKQTGITNNQTEVLQ